MIDKSYICRAEDFRTSWLPKYAAEMGQALRVHRKLWEFAVIGRVYEERTPVVSKCLGFGVGREPLATWLTKLGAEVVATDRPDETAEWTATGQHAQALEQVYDPNVGYPFEAFRHFATFEPVDMNDIPEALLRSQFDFTWSCGSFEHIGGIQAGIEFFLRQMHALKPGGWAVHTTEYNIGQLPLDAPNLCLFQRSDLEALEIGLADQGDRLLPLNFESGTDYADTYIDVPPYSLPHLKLQVAERFQTTSIVLIAQRGTR